MRMKNKGWVVLSSFLAFGVAAGGCGSDDSNKDDAAGATGGTAGTGGTGGDGTGGGDTESLEIFSWWTSGGEQEALEAVVNVFEADHPGVQVINAAVEYADAARDTLRERMAQGSPPDTFQANIGADLLSWVGDDAAQISLEPLDELAEEHGWMTAFPDELVAGASKGGSLYGVPMNVHRINSLFYDKRLFDAHGLTPPATIDELNTLVELIKTDPEIQASNAAGVAPLTLGNQWNWTLSLMVFENILPAIGGPDYYEDFWAGLGDPTDPQITETLEEILFLYCGADPTTVCDGYFNEDVDTVDWGPALGMLVDGRAAMAVMGDWAKGYLEGEGLVADEHFGVVPFPGSVGTFVFTADTFPLPKGAPNRALAVDLLTTFASVEGQVAFNAIKGSIPARSDFNLADYPESFDSMHIATANNFKNDQLVMALSGLLPSSALENLAPELKASLQDGSIEAIQNYLVANYGVLQ